MFGTKKFPKECYVDLIKSATKTIERAIHDANKQITETKKDLNVLDAKGLLLLANDGNYFLTNEGFLSVIANLMQRKFLESQIDGFVYFTVNQNSFMPNNKLDWHLWTPLYRKQNDITLGNFVNELCEKFLVTFLQN